MKRGAILILVGIIFLGGAGSALAGLEFSEIMYDLKTGSDEGREWVEVFNNSPEPVDLAKLKFFEADTNHKIIYIEGQANIPAQGYAVIASDPIKFKTDWQSFSGNLFDSTFSLSNTGEVLAVKSEDQILDQYTYSSSMGGSGDGKSLQKINGAWVASLPTPGGGNKLFTPPPPPPPKPTASKEAIKTQVNPEPTKIQEQEIKENPKSPYLFPIIQLVFLVTTSYIVYIVRRKRKAPKVGSDFEILDK